jgi:predicted NBD/HSP70 family sugar kinase
MSRTLSAGRGSRVDATRRHNLSTILTAVHHHPGMSRAELTRQTGLNRSTVGVLVAELADLGLVREVAPAEHASRGRPSPQVYPRTDVSVLAVNPDLDAVTIGLVGLGGTLHRRVRHEWKHPPSVDDTVEVVARTFRELRAEMGPDNVVLGAGVAVPGLIRSEGSFVVRAPHLDWTDVPLGEFLADALGVPVVIRNDARVATIAESVFGAGRGVRDVVYINGSPSGIGGGAVVDGITLRGHAGFGGEIGHTTVAGGREQCHCGRRGCLETEVSLSRLLAALGRDSVDLVDLDDELARAGADPTIRAEIQRQLSVLAGTIGNVISIFNPELVVLAGFLGSLYATAPALLDNAVAKDSFAQIWAGTRIERAQLGSRVHLVGAAELAFLPLLRDPASFAQASGADSGPRS